MTNGPLREHAPKLIVITDLSVAPEAALLERVERIAHAAEPGSVVVQLRDSALPGRERLRFGERLSSIAQRHGQWFVVGDRLDLVALLGADGVHLGEVSVSTKDARALLTPAAWVSRAVHTTQGASGADADAVLLSPIMAPRKGNPAIGTDAIRAVRAALGARKPFLYALGGVDGTNAAACLSAGADGVAVIGAALDGRLPDELLGALGIRRS